MTKQELKVVILEFLKKKDGLDPQLVDKTYARELEETAAELADLLEPNLVIK